MIILGVSSIVRSQENQGEENYINPVPENVMREVVRRILIYKFKPLNRKKIIYLAQEEINQSWLPEIKNVEFQLLSKEEISQQEKEVYFFRKPEPAENNNYEIGFAFGSPNCEYLGDNWRFRISGNNKVKLWLAGGVGGGCGSSSDFGAPPEQLNFYPNEIKGYEFFNKGKLKNLKLSVWTKEDVKSIFGNSCETSCDYDENWKI